MRDLVSDKISYNNGFWDTFLTRLFKPSME